MRSKAPAGSSLRALESEIKSVSKPACSLAAAAAGRQTGSSSVADAGSSMKVKSVWKAQLRSFLAGQIVDSASQCVA